MTENDKVILRNMLEKYNSEDINHFLKEESIKNKQLRDLFLEYLYTTNFNPSSREYVNPCVSITMEYRECFSNNINSLFITRDSFIKDSWLNDNSKTITKPIIYDINKNFENRQKVINLVSGNCFKISMSELNELVRKDKFFSTIELKLIRLLLTKPEIYMSKNSPAIIVESEKGTAYILGKDKKGQRTF